MNKSGLTQQEVDSAKDGEVKNGCLILTEEEYEEKAFQERKDFKFVIAKNFKAVSQDLFSWSSLQFACMPEVQFISDSAFKNSPLTAACFLKVKSVGAYSFDGCGELNQVFLPVCEKLGKQCFGGCMNIQILDLPKVKIIGEWQFDRCSSLTDLIIPLVEEIGDSCFRYCDSLESIDSKLDADQFRCTNDLCKENKRCPICRGQLPNCLDKGNDPQNRQRVQKEFEDQKLIFLKEAGVEPSSVLKDIKQNLQIRKKTKDEQIEDLKVKILKKDEQIEQISTQLNDNKQQHQQEIKRLMQQSQLNMEKMEEKFDIKVERMARKFENQEIENEELKKAVENFVQLLVDK